MKKNSKNTSEHYICNSSDSTDFHNLFPQQYADWKAAGFPKPKSLSPERERLIDEIVEKVVAENWQ